MALNAIAAGLRSSAVRVSGIIVAIGMLGSVQTGINAAGTRHFGSFIVSTFLSFSGGALLLLVAAAIECRLKQLPLLRFSQRPRWWQFIGGALGVTFVAVSAAATPIIGFALMFIAAIGGQLASSCTLDHFGWLGVKQTKMSRSRLAALAVVAAGAALTILDRAGSTSGGASLATTGGLFIVGVLAGTLMPIQAAVNRGVAALLPSKLQGALLSFAVGEACITVVLLAHVAVTDGASVRLAAGFAAAPPWMYTAGALGVLFIASGIWFIQTVGAALFFVLLIVGQLSASALLDAVGFLGLPQRQLGPSRAIGVLLVCAGAIMLQFGGSLVQWWRNRGKQAAPVDSPAAAGDSASAVCTPPADATNTPPTAGWSSKEDDWHALQAAAQYRYAAVLPTSPAARHTAECSDAVNLTLAAGAHVDVRTLDG